MQSMKRDEHGKINKFVFCIQVHSRLKFNRAICIVQNQPNISLRTCTHIYNIYLKKKSHTRNASRRRKNEWFNGQTTTTTKAVEKMRSLYCEQFIVTGSHMCVVCVHSHAYTYVSMHVIDAKLTCVYARRIYVALQQPKKVSFFLAKGTQHTQRENERAKEGERVNKMKTRT